MKLFNINKFIVMGGDALLLSLSYISAYLLRYESFTPEASSFINSTLVPVVVFKMLVLSYQNLYSGPWRFTGVLDLVNIIKASLLASLGVFAAMVYFHGQTGFPRSVIVIDAITTICFLGMYRLSIRLAYSHQLRRGILRRIFIPGWPSSRSGDQKNVLIYGANERGEMLARSILSSQESTQLHITGFVDNDPNKAGTIIHSIRHVGTPEDLESLIDEMDISEVMIASDPGKDTVRNIFMTCRKKKISCRVVPLYLDVLQQKVRVTSLKNIAIGDVLRREPVTIDYSRLNDIFKGKRILVTGAAGSIGKQLCLQLLEFEPAEIVCVDINENMLFFLQQEINERKSESRISFYCINVTNKRQISRVFDMHRPQVVFHAAAHKHVPLMESNIEEAISNNIGGTKAVIDTSCESRVETFIFISSDKAVKPKNVMGWTKRAGEVYSQYAAGKCDTKFLAVRFGNVLGSNGSVVPLFQKQIQDGGPLLVTHPEATRFFMTIPEAVLLILQAVYLGDSGDIMILDMGEPVKIVELAEEMIRLSGFTPGKEIEIKFTGLRPGEKLHEELLNEDEHLEKTAHPKIMLLKRNPRLEEDIPEKAAKILETCVKDPQTAYGLLKNAFSEVR